MRGAPSCVPRFGPADACLSPTPFGGAQVCAWRDEADAVHLPNLREAEYLYQTSSYLIWPEAARTLLAHLPIDAPADCFLAKHVLNRRLRALVAKPKLARQARARCHGIRRDVARSRELTRVCTHAQASPYCDGNIEHTNIYTS